MRCCAKCKLEKSTDLFSKDRSRSDGLQPYCKHCVYLYNKTYTQRVDVKFRHKERTKKFYHENKGRYRAYARKSDLKRLYDLTPEQYTDLLLKQNERCLICTKHKDEFQYKLCVDHHHVTKKVRGLLCKPCNLIIGNAKDSPQILSNTIGYLQK